MKLENFLTCSCSDDLLLQATKDFLISKTEQNIAFLEQMSDVIEHSEAEGYNVPVVNHMSSFQTENGSVVVFDSQDLLNALYQDEQTFDIVYDNTTYTINSQEAVEQLSSSLKANRVVVCALESLQQSGASDPDSVLSDFADRLSVKLGDLGEKGQQVAAEMADVILNAGSSIGDRVKTILTFCGIVSISQTPEELEEIGIPSNDLTDITGMNVAQAFFNELPRDIRKWGAWLKDAFNKIINLLEGILGTVLGSNVYRTIKKFFLTLTSVADAFAYNTATEDGTTFGDYGIIRRITNFEYNASWYHGSSTKRQLLETILGSSLNTYDFDSMSDFQIIQAIYQMSFGSGPGGPNTPPSGSPLNRAWWSDYYAGSDSYAVSAPAWIDVLYNSSFTELGYIARLYGRYGWHLYHFGSDITETDETELVRMFYGREEELLTYVLNAILDVSHVNDITGVQDKLNTRYYIRVDLPCSSLYFWLVGADVMVTRRTSPFCYYSEYTTYDDILNDVASKFGITLTNRQGQSGADLEHHIDTFTGFMQFMRTCNESYIQTDGQLTSSLYAAHVIDAMYLYYLHYNVNTRQIHMKDEMLNPPSIVVYGSAPTELENLINDYFLFLVGMTPAQWRVAYENEIGVILRIPISNRDVVDMLGARTQPVVTSFSDTIGTTPVGEIMMSLFYPISNDNYFCPYAKIVKIPVGRYHVTTDSELADVFTTLLEIAAVIASVIVVKKIIRRIKAKSISLTTKADALAWDAVTSGSYDRDFSIKQEKAYRHAAMLDSIAQAMSGSVSKVVKTAAANLLSATSAGINSVKNILSGEFNSSSSTEPSLKRVIQIITGQ